MYVCTYVYIYIYIYVAEAEDGPAGPHRESPIPEIRLDNFELR